MLMPLATMNHLFKHLAYIYGPVIHPVGICSNCFIYLEIFNGTELTAGRAFPACITDSQSNHADYSSILQAPPLLIESRDVSYTLFPPKILNDSQRKRCLAL